jgi:Fe-S-cluster containining protein
MEIGGLEQLYEEVDWLAAQLSRRNQDRMQCKRGCSGCCIDEITVFALEAENIREHYPSLLEHGTPHEPGECAFLSKDGACRIYAHRPYVCRTQGLPFRWIDEKDDGEFVEMRDICPLNEGDGCLERLTRERCWTIGPFEERLVELQIHSNGNMARIALRDLFPNPTA